MTRKKIIFSLLDESNQKVLDVGCSIGDFGLELALRGNQTLGIDINEEEIGIARKLAADFKADTAVFDVGDVFKKDFGNEKFDGILLCEIVEHFYNPELLLEKSFSLLKEGGWVVVSIPNIASLRNRLLLLIRGLFPDNQIFHHYYFTKADLLERIQKAGFRVVSARGDFIPFHYGHPRLRLTGLWANIFQDLSFTIIVKAVKPKT
jgi:2-polyprenyl-3-methyl-5-hydroxy-6-metoxy-1,4-benzoquinol methylase